jgi:hypothetical protein
MELGKLAQMMRNSTGILGDLRRDAVLFACGLNETLMGYLAAGAFLSVAYHRHLWYLTALPAALDIAVRRENEALRRPPSPSPACAS